MAADRPPAAGSRQVPQIRHDGCCTSSSTARSGASAPMSRTPGRTYVISTAHRRLFEQVEAAAFNADLYYRLNVMHLVMPPVARRR